MPDRKPVSQITDRAKRYRANRIHKKRKRCEECGSKRNLGVGHRDGDESNGRPSNLFTQCKSCNGIQAAEDKRMGRGVRTRQYNPVERIVRGSRMAAIMYNDLSGPFTTRLFVNNGETATLIAKKAKTIEGARKQAHKMLAEAAKNPGQDTISGHEGWKALMASKLAQKYDSLRLSGMSRDEAMAETLGSTTAGPGSIALFRKIAKNPGATNLAQYVQAAVEHTRKAHDAGGKVIHETPKAKRREFAREIAFRKGYRSNPSIMEFGGGRWQVDNGHGTILTLVKKSWGGWEVQGDNVRSRIAWRGPGVHTFNSLAEVERKYKAFRGIKQHIEGNPRGSRRNPLSLADALYKKFHGRGPDKIYEMQIAGIDPYGGHPELTSLGPLIRFIVGEGVELGGEYGDEVKQAEWVREISFVPSVDRWHEWLERTDPPVSEAKAKLRDWKAPDLAAVPNTKQLYILGGNQNLESLLPALGADPEKDLLDLGDVYLIEYFTQKRFDHFEPINYFHHFGEISGVTPRLIFDRVHKVLSLAGGEYVVKPAGITN